MVDYLSVFDRDGRPDDKRGEGKMLSERGLWDILGIGISGSSGTSKSASKKKLRTFVCKYFYLEFLKMQFFALQYYNYFFNT